MDALACSKFLTISLKDLRRLDKQWGCRRLWAAYFFQMHALRGHSRDVRPKGGHDQSLHTRVADSQRLAVMITFYSFIKGHVHKHILLGAAGIWSVQSRGSFSMQGDMSVKGLMK